MKDHELSCVCKDHGTLVGGDDTQLVGGNYTQLVGGNGAVIVGGNSSVVKGKKGCVIVLIERDENLNIINYDAVQVDGEKIKEDTLYKLEKGEFVEVEK